MIARDAIKKDAAAAALLTACKIEDTLKKSRDIVCAAYNLRLHAAEHMAPDDPVHYSVPTLMMIFSSMSPLLTAFFGLKKFFENHARGIIGLERLMLEASGFDFRTRHPQKVLIKLARCYGLSKESRVSSVAYRISIDLYRTFAPTKQTTSTMAFSCLELAGRLLDERNERVESGQDYEKWRTSREEVMGKEPSFALIYLVLTLIFLPLFLFLRQRHYLTCLSCTHITVLLRASGRISLPTGS